MKTGSHHLLRLKQPNTRVVCSIHSHSGNQSRNSIRSNQTTKHSDEWGGPAKYGWPQPMQSESPTKHIPRELICIPLSMCSARAFAYLGLGHYNNRSHTLFCFSLFFVSKQKSIFEYFVSKSECF
jgi:hypothetical protein